MAQLTDTTLSSLGTVDLRELFMVGGANRSDVDRWMVIQKTTRDPVEGIIPPGGSDLTSPQILSAFLQGLISRDEALQRLFKEGFSVDVANLTLETVGRLDSTGTAAYIANNPTPRGFGTGLGEPPELVEAIPWTPGEVSPSLQALRELQTQSAEGQRTSFNQFLANQGQNLNPAALALAGRNFDPLSAQFNLGEIANLGQGGTARTFRNFLSEAPNPQQSRAFFDERFNQVQPFFTNPLTSLSPEQAAARGALEEPGIGGNIIRQSIGAGLSPFLRPRLDPVLDRRFSAFQDTADPGTQSLFGEFLRRGRTF